MIIFRKCSWKNFLSTGNVENTVQLDSHKTTLVVGKNGHGKSTILDVLCFGLYGKAYRNINKGQLINSVNQKRSLVKVEFEANGNVYEIHRGQKPNIFEIYVDGVMLNQDAATKDYQSYLEQILKMNFKTFIQVVILGAQSSAPFMQLPAAARRDLIESVLDIKIFSVMNEVLKKRTQETKSNLALFENDINIFNNRIEAKKRLIDTISKNQESNENKITSRIEVLDASLDSLNQEKENNVNILAQKLEKIQDISTLEFNKKRAATALQDKEFKISSFETQLDFFTEHDSCPTCEQSMSTDHKNHMVHMCNSGIDILRKQNKIIQSAYDTVEEKLKKLQVIQEEIVHLKYENNSRQEKINNILNEKKSLNTELHELRKDKNLTAEEHELHVLEGSLKKSIQSRLECLEEKNIQTISSLLLKDSGIKTGIIKEYLPILNKLTNKFLQSQDSFIQFELDEEFNEKIKSRHRDEFSYSSFSEGEKSRIDIALLFTWREIARKKNSASTNLLIMDEILDSSLDADGLDSSMSLIVDLSSKGTNVFVISHSTHDYTERFERVVEFKKVKDFSIII